MKHEKIVGYCLLLLYVVSNLSLTKVTRITLDNYDHALIVRYINSSMLSLDLLIPILYKIQRRLSQCYNHYNNPHKSKSRIKYKPRIPALSTLAANTPEVIQKNLMRPNSRDPIIEAPFHIFLGYTLLCCFTATGAGMFWFISLQGTTIATNISLGGLKAVWVFILSVVFLNEKISAWKILAVLFSFAGVVVFGIEIEQQLKENSTESGDEITNRDTFWGALFCLASSFLFAMKDIVFRLNANRCFQTHKLMGTFLNEGYEGLWTIVVFSWVFMGYNSSGDGDGNDGSTLEWPSHTALLLIIGNGMCLLCTLTFYDFAISFIPPTQMVVGSLLIIPCGFCLDIMFSDYQLSFWAILGSLLIVTGFLMLKIIAAPSWCEPIDVYLKFQKVTTKTRIEKDKKEGRATSQELEKLTITHA